MGDQMGISPIRTGRGVGTVSLAAAILAVLASAADPPAHPGGGTAAKANLRTYETPYYTIHTDLPIEQVREAAVRLTAMAEEYHRRTRDFAGTIRRRLPFYLFSKAEDYHAAGGRKGSAGLYLGGKGLMALACGPRTWHVVQHEGFHQFAHRAIGGELPIWANEGLAEYFGHGIWTGDGFVTGVIPPYRLKRVQDHIRANRLLPFPEMLAMSYEGWRSKLASRNYDQAWSMVHFLVHADDGKYRSAFGAFLGDISAGRSYRDAFVERFGRNVEAFQKKHAHWWLGLTEEATADLHTKALVATLTSYLARARLLRLKLDSVEDFFAAAREGRIRIDAARHPRYWLPPSLLTAALEKAKTHGGWSLDTSASLPRLVLRTADGTTYTGSFALLERKPEVRVKAEKPAAARPPDQPTTGKASGR
jgi:hypothetical protein